MNTSPNPATTAQSLLTRRELATRWHCTPRTIDRHERAGKLQAVYIGPRTVRFRLTDILAIEAGQAIRG